ncbi:MAG: hypothetical protein ACYC44_00550 [Patescibacteria group bacterium]
MKFKFERQAKRHLKQAASDAGSPTIQRVSSHKVYKAPGEIKATKKASKGRAHCPRAFEIDPTTCRTSELMLLADEDLDAA